MIETLQHREGFQFVKDISSEKRTGQFKIIELFTFADRVLRLGS